MAGKSAKEIALIAAVVIAGLGAVVLPIVFRAWKNAVDNSRERQAVEPFRIAGNLYFTGINDTTVLLVTGPQGDVLIDTPEAPTAPLVLASIAKLGVNIKDVKALLVSDAHAAGGLAALQQASGAAVWASDANATVLASGGDDPELSLPFRALVHIGVASYPAVRVDRRLKDGDVVRVGPIAITAHVTGGAARGCTSWSFPVRDGARLLTVVSACGLTRAQGQRYPGQDADLARSFGVLRGLPADIWVTGRTRLWGRYRKFAASRDMKNPVDAFIDPAGYRAFIDDAEDELRRDVVH